MKILSTLNRPLSRVGFAIATANLVALAVASLSFITVLQLLWAELLRCSEMVRSIFDSWFR